MQSKINIGPVEDPAGGLWLDDQPGDRFVSAGDWQLTLRGAELADLGFAGQPVLRAIRFIVRDHDWRTADDVVTGVAARDDDALILNVRSRFDDRAVLDWTMVATFHESTLRVEVAAEAVAPFRRNRIGLIMLHQPDLAGTRLEITHPDDTVTQTQFPSQISPHQPARDVAGYRWRTAGLDCAARFGGDVFEMEDQRNWTDASYKTYSTRLDLPFPVDVPDRTRIEQALEVHCTEVTPAGYLPDPLLIMPTALAMPILQLGACTAPTTTPKVAGMPILVEIPADEPCWRDVLRRGSVEAGEEKLDVRIVASAPSQIRPVIKELAVPDLAPGIARLGVYSSTTSLSDGALVKELQQALDDHGWDVGMVVGSRAHFTELNRHIEDFAELPGGLGFSVTPQMHDRSRAQVLESVPMQRRVAEQAVRMASGRGVHIGPLTLRPRFNAVATTPVPAGEPETAENGYGPESVPEATDPRQDSVGLASWTIASIAALAIPGVDSITVYESSGPRGIRRPDGTLTPAGQVIDWVNRAGALQTPPGLQSIIGRCGCIAQQTDGGTQLLIGNLDADESVITLADAAARLTDQLGGQSAINAVDDHAEVRIPAYSATRVIIARA